MIAPNARRSPGAPKQTRFLSQRFRRVEGETAPPGLRGQYAVVRQAPAALAPLPRLEEEPVLACAGEGPSR